MKFVHLTTLELNEGLLISIRRDGVTDSNREGWASSKNRNWSMNSEASKLIRYPLAE